MSITLPPLPYAVDALEPHLSRRALSGHHGNHHAAYVAKSRALIRTSCESARLEDVVRSSATQDRALFNASAQAWNHAFLWRSMSPSGGGEARGAIAEAIEASFGSQRIFSQQFVTAAGDLFGSGWAWLVLDGKVLKVESTPNQDVPFLSTTGASNEQKVPLLGLDVWEHAYYLKYQNRRADYITAWFNVVNWDYVAERFQKKTA